MRHTFNRLVVCLLALAAMSAVATATATEVTKVAAFGGAVAAEWAGVELDCPPGSHDWLGATPETLYCFRVGLSGLSLRARLSGHLERQGIWLTAWKQETPELMSRPLWADGSLFRIVVGSSFSAPRSSVVFILHSAVE